MKKVILWVVTLITISLSSVVSAADVSILKPEKSVQPQIAVVLIGDQDFKTQDYFERVEKYFNNANQKVKVGTDIQSEYQKYWFEKGFIEEQQLTKTDLVDFTKFISYDKVLFLVIDIPVIEKNNIRTGLFSSINRTRTSVEIKAFLATNTEVLHIMNVTKKDDSNSSELRAKRGAFGACMKEIASEMKVYMK